jgi:hypothetical protein
MSSKEPITKPFFNPPQTAKSTTSIKATSIKFIIYFRGKAISKKCAEFLNATHKPKIKTTVFLILRVLEPFLITIRNDLNQEYSNEF